MEQKPFQMCLDLIDSFRLAEPHHSKRYEKRLKSHDFRRFLAGGHEKDGRGQKAAETHRKNLTDTVISC